VTAAPTVGSRDEWLAARASSPWPERKDLNRRRDKLAEQRRALPWVRIEKAYRFDGPDGPDGPGTWPTCSTAAASSS
jgi:predicted dithiol-disulfide oxidoreductase (DUF899 family)